jgi:hypothetical protein
MPQYVDALAPERQGQGYEGHPARRVRLEHQALAHVFHDWDERTSKQLKVRWGGTIERDTKIYMAAVVVDQPQLDKFTGCPGEQKCKNNYNIGMYCVLLCSNCMFSAGCQRCTCPAKEFLNPHKSWPAKTTVRTKAEVLRHSAGVASGASPVASPVVEFTDDGQTRPGPSAKSYESRRAFAGAHLMFNAFWMISTFCIHQMYMRDSLHQVDHGIIIHIMRGILRLFQGEFTSTAMVISLSLLSLCIMCCRD